MGRSSVLAPVLHIADSSPGFSVGDSVGHTASSLPTGILDGVVEEDGRFRPKSVDLLGDCRIIDSRAPITLDAREDNNKGAFPLVLTISVAAVVLEEDDKPGEAGAGLHPGLPGTSFRPSEGGVAPKMDSQSGTQMSIRSWNCPSNYIHPKGLTVDDGRCHPKLKYKRGKGVS